MFLSDRRTSVIQMMSSIESYRSLIARRTAAARATLMYARTVRTIVGAPYHIRALEYFVMAAGNLDSMQPSAGSSARRERAGLLHTQAR